MNAYRKAMEQYPLPDGLEERLRERVLAAQPAGCRGIYRPRLRRKMVAACVALMLLTTAATFVLPWDPFFHHRYGIFNVLAENAFQKVNVTAVCGDVTVTLREVIGDASSFSYILDYQLPESTSPETLALLEENGGAFPAEQFYCLTGDITWEEYAASDREKWASLNWTDYCSWVQEYWNSENNLFYAHKLGGNASGHGSMRYDPETRTITYLFQYQNSTPGVNFTAQPVTIVLAPPVLHIEEKNIALAEHPVLVTFLPDYRVTERVGQFSDDTITVNVKLTSMVFSLEYTGTEYANVADAIKDTRLVYTNGTELPLTWLAVADGSGSFGPEDGPLESLNWSSSFRVLTDTSEFAAVRLGSHEITLQDLS